MESGVGHAGHGDQQFAFERRKHQISLAAFAVATKSDAQVSGT
jgi:hypothetical protein